MSDRKSYSISPGVRPAETGAPLAVIDDRVPAVFELRRLFYPKFESLSGRDDVDRGIAGFLDHILKPTFTAFVSTLKHWRAMTSSRLNGSVNRLGCLTPFGVEH